MSHLLARIIVLMILAAATSPGFAAPPAVTIPEIEYQLMATVLRHGLDPSFKQLVIADTTSGDPTHLVDDTTKLEEVAKKLESTPAALADWAQKNQARVPLGPVFELKVSYRLLSLAEHDRLFQAADPKEGWRRFFELFPQAPGLLRLSRVGIDPEQRAALIYVEFQCGAECGSGRLVSLVQAASGQWQVTGGELLWIAGPR